MADLREQVAEWLYELQRNLSSTPMIEWRALPRDWHDPWFARADSLRSVIDPDGKLNEPLALATEFSFDTGDPFSPVTVNLTCRAGEGPHRPAQDTWAVHRHGRCLNADGDWEFEPQPSSRDDEFLARCRWTRDEAIERARGEAARAHSERAAVGS